MLTKLRLDSSKSNWPMRRAEQPLCRMRQPSESQRIPPDSPTAPVMASPSSPSVSWLSVCTTDHSHKQSYDAHLPASAPSSVQSLNSGSPGAGGQVIPVDAFEAHRRE